jgi:hypothetical protein
MLAEPLSPPVARKLLGEIARTGEIRFSKHALEEMAADGFCEDDVRAVLRGGIVEPAELQGGSWRYRVRAGRAYVVVAFRSEALVVVVTAWRTR